MKSPLSPRRLLGMIIKELIQMRRDRMTFAIMFGLPIVQMLLFGFVINSDPRHLPTAVLAADDGPEVRTLLQGLRNSTYFDFVRQVSTEEEGRILLTRGEVQFVVNIPQNFSHDLLRGDRPVILLEADATDPIATSGGASALGNIVDTAFQTDFVGPLEFLAPSDRSIDIRVHSLYNPEAITSYNIVPGLMGVVLTMTLVMVTALAITREYERGTMENLLSMPLRASEVLVGKDYALHTRWLCSGGVILSYRQRPRWDVDTKTARGDCTNGKCKSFRCKICEPLNQARTKERTNACRQ